MIQSEKNTSIYESLSVPSNPEGIHPKFKNQLSTARHVYARLFGAAGVELGLAVGGEQTPVLLVHGLAVVTNAVGLPGLVVGLEVEQVNAPGEHATDTGLPEGLGVFGTSQSSLVVRATVWKKIENRG